MRFASDTCAAEIPRSRTATAPDNRSHGLRSPADRVSNLDMRSASPTRPLLLLATLALTSLVAPTSSRAAPVSIIAAPAPPPGHAPAPRASADAKRMVAMTFTNLVVFDNGAGYLHGFWRTLGTAGPDTPGRLQWGRGCPDISERVFLALHTAFANPGQFFLIVDKSPDPRQSGAHCVTHIELERIGPAPEPAQKTAPVPAAPASPPASSAPPPLMPRPDPPPLMTRPAQPPPKP